MSKKTSRRQLRTAEAAARKEAVDIAAMPLRDLSRILREFPADMARIVKAVSRLAVKAPK